MARVRGGNTDPNKWTHTSDAEGNSEVVHYSADDNNETHNSTDDTDEEFAIIIASLIF